MNAEQFCPLGLCLFPPRGRASIPNICNVNWGRQNTQSLQAVLAVAPFKKGKQLVNVKHFVKVGTASMHKIDKNVVKHKMQNLHNPLNNGNGNHNSIVSSSHVELFLTNHWICFRRLSGIWTLCLHQHQRNRSNKKNGFKLYINRRGNACQRPIYDHHLYHQRISKHLLCGNFQ